MVGKKTAHLQFNVNISGQVKATLYGANDTFLALLNLELLVKGVISIEGKFF